MTEVNKLHTRRTQNPKIWFTNCRRTRMTWAPHTTAKAAITKGGEESLGSDDPEQLRP